MEAFVYLRVKPGSIEPVRNHLTSSAVARRSIVVIGDWDVLCLIDGPDIASIGTGVLSEIQIIEGIERTYTAQVVPQDRLGVVGFGGLPTPQIIRGACYVHIAAEPGAAAGLYERLSEIGGGSGGGGVGGGWGPDGCVAGPGGG